MDKQVVIRRIRIAVSVFFGVLCVTLLGLSARSYRIHEIVSKVDSNGMLTTFGSGQGRLYYIRQHRPEWPVHDWRYGAASSIAIGIGDLWPTRLSNHFWMFPIWPVAFLSAASAYAPWGSLQFSLRTLLITTTLIAVVLGLGVWLAS